MIIHHTNFIETDGILRDTAGEDDNAPTPADLTEEQMEHFIERAAIREFDGGLPRQEAERLALAEVMKC